MSALRRPWHGMNARALGLAAGLLGLPSCSLDYEVIERGPSADAGQELLASDICARGGDCSRLIVLGEDRLDLLFVVDNSGSMREEQAALRAELPELLRALTSGDHDHDGTQELSRARDMHIGVVTTDLGMAGIAGIPQCNDLGDEGALVRHHECDIAASGPYIEYGEGREPMLDDVERELQCLTELGTMGCGFEQQLESMLKAVWPSDDRTIEFLPSPTGFGAMGQGAPRGANGDFIRHDPDDPSVIAVVLVTDEEDCSFSDPSHLRPDDGTLDQDDPLKQQGLNTRCFHESMRDRDATLDGIQNNLFSPQRYVDALRALRPGHPERVLFAAIVGVPRDRVEAEDLAGVDFGVAAQSRAFYDAILADDRMLEVVDDRDTDQVSDDNLVPSCDRGENQKAYPPRRILEVAAGFGEYGVVQSICQDDFGPALDVIAHRIGERLSTSCLDAPLERVDGKVACDVIWELPGPSEAAPSVTPRTCDAKPFLSTHAPRDASRGALCKVAQVAVRGSELDFGDGFYWDDTSEASAVCDGRGRISFTTGAKPSTGVSAYLDCD